MEWRVYLRLDPNIPIFHYSSNPTAQAQVHGPTSAVRVTDDRTSIVPASTGVGAATGASICVTRGWGIMIGLTARSHSVTESTLMILRPRALAISSALALALVDARRNAWSWALCSSLRVKSR